MPATTQTPSKRATLEIGKTRERRTNAELELETLLEDLTQLLATSLSNVQRSFAKHAKELSRLKHVYLQSNNDVVDVSQTLDEDDTREAHVSYLQRRNFNKAFRRALFGHLNRVLTIYEREAAVERVVQFLVSLINEVTLAGGELEKEFSSSDCLLLQTIKHLSKYSGVGDKAVRFRCCQLLSLLISKFSKEISQHESFIVEELREVLLTRTKDKIPIVRQFALSALLTLQNTEEANRESPVVRLARATREGLKLLSSDPSKDVRKVAVCNITVNKYTLPELLKRLRDINAEVRSSTLTLLKDRVKMDMLEFAHLKELIDSGLRDREPKVQEACVDLFCHWFESYERDAEKFLSSFKVQENEEGTELVIKRLMMKLQPTSYSFSDFSPEAVFYWRIFCEFVRRNALEMEDSQVSEVFPEIIEVANLVEIHGNDLFTLKQLLLIALCLDFSDEAGRRKLIQVLRSSLSSPNVTSTVLPLVIKVLRACCDSEAQYQQLVLEAVSDISDPLDLDEDSDSGNEGTKKEDTESSKKKEEAWYKCLAISSELLIHTRKDMSDPGVAGLLETVILPCIPHQNPDIRKSAIRCLGLLCLLDKVTAEDYLVLFLQAVNNDTEEIQAVAIQAIYDLMLVYGITELTIDPEQEDFLMRAFDPTKGSLSNEREKESLPPLVSTLLKVSRKHPNLVCEVGAVVSTPLYCYMTYLLTSSPFSGVWQTSIQWLFAQSQGHFEDDSHLFRPNDEESGACTE
jgi:condensin complex subunit 3